MDEIERQLIMRQLGDLRGRERQRVFNEIRQALDRTPGAVPRALNGPMSSTASSMWNVTSPRVQGIIAQVQEARERRKGGDDPDDRDGGGASVREPLRPKPAPPSLYAEVPVPL